MANYTELVEFLNAQENVQILLIRIFAFI